MYKTISQIHMIGVGGIGMSGIAKLLLTHGYSVSGSDLHLNDGLKSLEGLGARVFAGHDPAHVEGAELVVYSSAIQDDNPELLRAKKLQIPTIPRADMLAELMRLKYGIAVAGAHGKTTTTSMMGTLLMSAGLDPTIIVGGRMDNFGGTNARLGRGDFMVVEADESDGSFLKLSPSISIVTNIDREHMDYYQTMASLKKAFVSFVNSVPFYGLSVLCGDDPYVQWMLPRIARRHHTYGFSKENHYRVVDYSPTETGSTFKIESGGKSEQIQLQVHGRHNALNATAVLAVADELGIERKASLSGLFSFQGVQRRFQIKGEIRGVMLVDDYAHHPREIAATLAAARERFPASRLRVIFQPHRYSRVEDLFHQFAQCFHDCDAVAITKIYSAGEKPVAGIDAERLVESVASSGHPKALYFEKPIEGMTRWLSESKPGDVILTLGAGDLPNVYRDLL